MGIPSGSTGSTGGPPPPENPTDCYFFIQATFGQDSSKPGTGDPGGLDSPPFGMNFDCDDVNPGTPDDIPVFMTIDMCGKMTMDCYCEPDGTEEYSTLTQDISPLDGWRLKFEMLKRVCDCSGTGYIEVDYCDKHDEQDQCIPVEVDANGTGLSNYCRCLKQVTTGLTGIICSGGATNYWLDYCRRKMSACLDKANGSNGYGELPQDLVDQIKEGLDKYFDNVEDDEYCQWCRAVSFPGGGSSSGGSSGLGTTFGDSNRQAQRRRKLRSLKGPPLPQ